MGLRAVAIASSSNEVKGNEGRCEQAVQGDEQLVHGGLRLITQLTVANYHLFFPEVNNRKLLSMTKKNPLLAGFFI
jgi:hypothetical protein